MMFTHNEPSNSVGLQFWAVYSKWHMEVLSRLKPLNLTHTQFVILAAILWCKKNQQPRTQSKIVSITGLDKMTLSKALKGLVSLGVVIKQKDKYDSRTFVLALSSNGEKITKKAVVLVENLDKEFFGAIGEKKKSSFRVLLLDYRKSLS